MAELASTRSARQSNGIGPRAGSTTRRDRVFCGGPDFGRQCGVPQEGCCFASKRNVDCRCRPTIAKRRCGYFAMFWMVSGFAPFKFARRRLSHSESKGRMVARPPERCLYSSCGEIRLGFRGRSMLGRGMPTSRCECLGPDADRRERRMEHWIRCGWPGSALDARCACRSSLAHYHPRLGDCAVLRGRVLRREGVTPARP